MLLNRLIILIFFIGASFSIKAQQVHFVYLQTENGQPFYVKLDNKITSSSSAGYLILPKLSEGDYSISVGFPKKEFPEENFQISVDKENKGFLLKNFGEKGWGLFNLQSFDVVMGNSLNNTAATAKNLQEDAFSKMLANVVNDSSILEKNNISEVTPLTQKAGNDTATNNLDTVVKNSSIENINTDTISKKNDSENITTTFAINDTLKSAANQDAQAVALSNITRTLNKKNIDGTEMVYVDKDDISSDTIRIFIPAEQSIKKATGETSEVERKEDFIVSDTAVNEVAPSALQQNNDSLKSVSGKVLKREDEAETRDSIASSLNSNQYSDSNNLKPLETINISGDEIKEQDSALHEVPKVVESSTSNSDCKAFASNEDFIKLRKKMAGEKDNDGMIRSAKKFFRSQCFSTEQIKNLSFLFLNDEGKYQFFDAAYAFTSDTGQYHTLQSQLKDPYYINRFKAMIHK